MITNPILRGFHPDPSIVRVGDDYYVATSTFEWFPGVRIHHSRDLKHWRLLTHALTRTSQLNMEGNPDSCGVWAPCLTHKDGIFYLLFTDVKSRRGAFKDTHNYVVTADRIEGPWSDPVFLNSSGFDPSLFHDDDGRSWLLNMLWDHRAKRRDAFAGIVLQEYNVGEKCLVGERKIIFKGTPLQLTEGPHLYKRKGYYYLVVAEGGTEYGHAVTIARSAAIDGPYEVDPTNPVLTSSGKSDWPLQKAGHGCLVETQGGEWAMVHLVGRPVKDGRCVLGRETAIQPMEWTEDGWIRVRGGGNVPHVAFEAFDLAEHPFPSEPDTDHFDSEPLNMHWSTLRLPPDATWLTLAERPGYLRLRGRESMNSLHRQSLIARRQQAKYCEAETSLEFEPEHFQQMAGFILYYDTMDYVYLRVSRDEVLGKCIGIVRSVGGVFETMPDTEVSIEGARQCKLKVKIEAQHASFSFAVDEVPWKSIGPMLDILHLADEPLNGAIRFTGNFIGLCAQDGSGMRIHADFDYFRYTEFHKEDTDRRKAL